MQTVDKELKKYFEECTLKIETKTLSKGELITLYSEAIKTLCEKYKIRYECKETALKNVDCFCSKKNDKDIIFYFNSEYYFARYFTSDSKVTRLKGIIEVLSYACRSVKKANTLIGITKGYLSPDTINMVREKTTNCLSFPKILYRYPLLEKQYNLDGSEKGLEELFAEMFEDLKKIYYKNSELTSSEKREYKDCCMFYYEIILPKLEVATDKDYNNLVYKYGAILLQTILSDMEKYYNNRALRKFKASKRNKLEIERDLKKNVNAIVRFRNGVEYNEISEKLLREGGFVRGTREVLPKEVFKRRKMFADSLVNVYDTVESESEYKHRAENEKNDIDEVINALYYNRFENFLKNVEISEERCSEIGKVETARMAQILKIVKIVSSTLKRDYYSEFLSIPDVNRWISVLEKDESGYLKDCMKNSRIRFKEIIYPETEAENGKYKEYILGNDTSEDGIDIKNKVLLLKKEKLKFGK